MTNQSDAERLASAIRVKPTAVWRMQRPQNGAYCMEWNEWEEHNAREYYDEQLSVHPKQAAQYEIKRVEYFTEHAESCNTAADLLEQIAARNPGAGLVPEGLIAALRGGRQCDMEGAEIIMSRQACCEAADILESLSAAPDAPQPVEPESTGCACKWQGDVYISRCELHESWHDAIQDWSRRAKTAENKLKKGAAQLAQAVPWLTEKEYCEFSSLQAKRIAKEAAEKSAQPASQAVQPAEPLLKSGGLCHDQ